MRDKKFTSIYFLQQAYTSNYHKPLEQMDLMVYYWYLIVCVCFKVVPVGFGFVSPNITSKSRRL